VCPKEGSRGRRDALQPGVGESFGGSRNGSWALEDGVMLTGDVWESRDHVEQLRERHRGC
jgi:hypothetical protein